MSMKPFNPAGGQTFIMANAVGAASSTTAQAAAMRNCDQIAFYNSSATAIAFVRVTVLNEPADTAVAATATTDIPIPPGMSMRLTFGIGPKKVSAIASAADGNLYVTPGVGN
jgi:hypothetical protein